MYCTKCGVQLEESDRFCSQCGAATGKPPAFSDMPPKRLMRSLRDRKIAGVCGGIGEYLAIDSTVIRIIFLVLLFTPPVGIVAYIVGWIIMPKEPEVPLRIDVVYGATHV